jgi:GTP-binding protein HflX
MSRQAGGQVGGGVGIGSRGPGETKIELDRRRINTRMAKLRKQIKEMAPARATKRASRSKNEIPAVAIAGYTNAGKSSLLNRITRAGVLVENALFATLDPTVRKTQTADGREYTIADTVGFVKDLPHQLVEAFRSTIEEIAHSDLVVHVVDASHPDPAGQIQTVRTVLAEVDAQNVRELLVFNKCDLVDLEQQIALRGMEPCALLVSAATGEGIEQLLEKIEELLPKPEILVRALIPYSRGDLVSRIHSEARIVSVIHKDEGTLMEARVKPQLASELKEFLLDAS